MSGGMNLIVVIANRLIQESKKRAEEEKAKLKQQMDSEESV